MAVATVAVHADELGTIAVGPNIYDNDLHLDVWFDNTMFTISGTKDDIAVILATMRDKLEAYRAQA